MADVAPAATVTDAGTVATLVFELVRVTTAPPVGAATERVTVPVLAAPPVTDAGDRATEDTPFSICASRPDMMIGPQPESVSQPGPAFDTTPFGKVPFVPEMTSKKTLERPLNE